MWKFGYTCAACTDIWHNGSRLSRINKKIIKASIFSFLTQKMTFSLLWLNFENYIKQKSTNIALNNTRSLFFFSHIFTPTPNSKLQTTTNNNINSGGGTKNNNCGNKVQNPLVLSSVRLILSSNLPTCSMVPSQMHQYYLPYPCHHSHVQGCH